MPLRVELPGVARGVGGDALQQVLVQLGQDDDVGLVREVQPVHLLHDTGEARSPPRVVADRGEDAAKLTGNRIGDEPPSLARIAEVAQVLPELVVDEPEHVVGVVGAVRPRCPAELAVQAAPILPVVEVGLLLTPILGLVECLEEEQPGELLDVIPRRHAVAVELVAGVLHRLPDLLAPVPGGVVGWRGHSAALD